MLFQNQDQQAELKKDVEVTLKQNEDDHRIKERELKTDNRYLKTQVEFIWQYKEQELSHLDYNFALNAEWDKKMTLQRQEYERQFIEVKKKYDLKMRKMRTEMEEARAQQIRQAEDKKDAIIAQLTHSHIKKYMDIKAYYADITTNNIANIKLLKNQIAGYQKRSVFKKRGGQVQDQAAADREGESRAHGAAQEHQRGDPAAARADPRPRQGYRKTAIFITRSKNRRTRSTSSASSASCCSANRSTSTRSSSSSTTSSSATRTTSTTSSTSRSRRSSRRSASR